MYYVLIVNVYGTTESAEKFSRREDAINYMHSLPDIHYMVILRNDDYAMKTLHAE